MYSISQSRDQPKQRFELDRRRFPERIDDHVGDGEDVGGAVGDEPLVAVALENPGDPDAAKLNDPAEMRRSIELDGRYLGWAIFVARNGLD